MVYRSLLGYFSSESTMFTSLPPRRLRWSAGAAGRSSPNRVPAPHSGMSLLVLPKGVGVRVALPGQRQICGSSFSKKKKKIVFGKNVLMPMAQGSWGPAPLGKSGVHRIIRCPSLLSALRRLVCYPCQCSRAQRSPASASLSLFRPEM